MRMHLGVPLILSPTYINPCYLPTQTLTSTHNEDELIIIIIARRFAVIVFHCSLFIVLIQKGNNGSIVVVLSVIKRGAHTQKNY